MSTVGYLSPEWIGAMAVAVETSERLREVAAGHAVGLTQVVTDTPRGDVTYHVQVRDGRISFAEGPAEPEDVRFVESWTTAVAVARGELNAQAAFIEGHIRFTGDHERLIEAGEVFAELNPVFDEVRQRTSFDAA